MNNYSEADIAKIVSSVISQMGGKDGTAVSAPASGCGKSFPVEISARHVHLTQGALDILFGKGHQLTKKKDLSQPGQFASAEKLKIVTAKGEISGVSVLGPVRSHIQVELSATDARALGINAPLRISGDLSGAADVLLMGPCGMLEAKGSAIVAQAHIHMTPADAAEFGVCDNQLVSVRLNTERPVSLERVAVRVSDTSALAMHIDTDEANAGMVPANAIGYLAGSGSVQYCCPPPQKEVRPVKYEKLDNKSRFLGQNSKLLITETVAKQMICHGETYIDIPSNAIVTPGAKDIFIREKVTLNFQK